jgi:hypothetical protein
MGLRPHNEEITREGLPEFDLKKPTALMVPGMNFSSNLLGMSRSTGKFHSHDARKIARAGAPSD